MKKYRDTIRLLAFIGMVSLVGCSNSNIPSESIPESTTVSGIEESSVLETVGTETAGTESLPSKTFKSEVSMSETSLFETSLFETSVPETSLSESALSETTLSKTVLSETTLAEGRSVSETEPKTSSDQNETTSMKEASSLKETTVETLAESKETTMAETEAETTLPVETTTVSVVLQGYLFRAGGISIGMHEDAEGVLATLGAADAYFETPSCAFLGVDRQYTYGSYMLTTYEENGREYVYDIYFLDETVSTPEGIQIGSGMEEMIAAYGNGYTEDFGMYTYTKERSKLQFLVVDGVVTSVDYTALTN